MDDIKNKISGLIHEFEFEGMKHRRISPCKNTGGNPHFEVLSNVTSDWVSLTESPDNINLCELLESLFTESFDIEKNIVCPFCGETMFMYCKRPKKLIVSRGYTCPNDDCRTTIDHHSQD
jgi:hypothetical protein